MVGSFRLSVAALIVGLATAYLANAEEAEWKPFSRAVAVCRAAEPCGYFLGKVKIGNRSLECVVDTGASFTFIDSALVTELGDPVGQVQLGQSSGGATVQAYRAESIELLGVKDHGLSQVFAIDLSNFRESGLGQFRAIVGMDFLQQYCLCIDCHAGVLTVCEADQVRLDQLRDACKLHFDSTRRPYLSASIGGNFREEMLIDTGCALTATLAPIAFGRAVNNGAVSRLQNDHTKVGLDGINWTAAGRLNQLQFENWTLQNLLVTSDSPSKLGTYFLRRFRVVLDFRGEAAYFEKSPVYNDLDRSDCDGLRVFNHYFGVVIIDAVEPGSFAARSGFQAQDILLSVDDRQVSEIGVHGVRRMLSLDPRDSIDCVVGRKGKRQAIKLRRSPTPPQQQDSSRPAPKSSKIYTVPASR